MINILVTPQGYELLGDELLELYNDGYDIEFVGGQIAEKEELISKLKNVDGCIIGAEMVDKEVFDNCPNLKILSRFGVGYNSIDVDEAKKHNVRVAIVSNVNSMSVARHCLSLMLSLTNNILIQKKAFKNNEWLRSYNLSPQNKTVGIIGCGAIGMEFARLCTNLGYKIIYYLRNDSIHDLIKQSDIVSLHLKSTKETEGIIDKDCIDLLEGKYFLNTARADLVDEKYLYDKISTMKGIGLDVYSGEPDVSIPDEVRNADNVVLTCHTACYDEESVREVGVQAINNIKYFFNEELDKVNKFV
jgi:D-3-phosphoglycerate dehydrogenase